MLSSLLAMAGNIIPAIATTNAVIAGLIVLEGLKILNSDFEQCRTVSLRFFILKIIIRNRSASHPVLSNTSLHIFFSLGLSSLRLSCEDLFLFWKFCQVIWLRVMVLLLCLSLDLSEQAAEPQKEASRAVRAGPSQSQLLRVC